jgi:small subunit ribosomal protein S13
MENNKPDVDKNFKYFIRVANTDLDGNKSIGSALRKIKGVNFMFANMVCQFAGVDKNTKAGLLDNSQVKKIDEVVSNPLKFKAPSWMLNRRKDYETGADKHLLSGELSFFIDNDIKRMKKMRSYRGVRHGQGLPVRGQRTKSNFRRNKGKTSIGVKKKSAMAAKSGKQ